MLIEGLKKKGYEFDDRIELESFIRDKCKCEDRSDTRQKTYFVGDVPFLLFDYNIDWSHSENTTTATHKGYAFL